MSNNTILEDFKTYVFFHRTVTNVGGGEIYLRNKINFLKKKGFNIYVITTMYGKLYINDLREYATTVIPEFCYDPYLYSEKKRKELINVVFKMLNLSKNVLIESHTLALAKWAEIYVKEYGGKNFVFLIDDNFKELSECELNFFIFKHSRRSLLGISPHSLNLLFKEKYIVPEGENYNLPFFCNNSIEPAGEKIKFDFNNYDIKIATISRLEKISVPIICSEVVEFAKKNTEKKILYVIFGGTESQHLIKKLKKKFSRIHNVNFFITGLMYPISVIDVYKFDLFISLAGAARATFNFGIPTLSIDVMTGKPLGILGYNTIDTQYSSLSKYVWKDICSVLTEYFILKTIVFETKIKMPMSNLEEAMNLHIKFVNESLRLFPRLEYYDFSHYICIDKKKKIILRIISFFLSGKHFYFFFNVLHKIKECICI